MWLIPSHLTGTCRRLGREPCGLRGSGPRLALWYIHMFTLFSAWSLQTFFATKLVFMYILYTLGRRDVRSSCTFEDKNVNISWTGVIFLVTSVSCWIPYLSCSPKSGDRGNSITVQFVLFKKPEAGPCPPVPAPPPLSDSTCVALT